MKKCNDVIIETEKVGHHDYSTVL